MSQQTLAQTRVINPILSTHARGFRQPGFIGRFLFPVAPVAMYGGQVIEFGKEAFRLYNADRSPGQTTKRIDVGYAGKPYAIVPRALEAKVPYERMKDASQVPGIDLASRSVNTVLRALQLGQEYKASQIALNAANYDNDHKVTLTGANSWNVATVNPTKDILTAKTAVGDSIGVEANLVALSGDAWNALQLNPFIVARLNALQRDVLTPELLAVLWGVDRVVVGKAKVATGVNDTLSSVWGDDVVVAYVAPEVADGNDQDEPSYGYTYQIEGMPAVEEPYQDKGARSWIYQVADDAAPVLAGMAAGYLIKGAGLAAT